MSETPERKPRPRRVLRPVAALAEADAGPAAEAADETPPPERRIAVPAATETVEQRERRHEALAKSSPLALAFQLVGCQLARAIEAEGRVTPVGYEFSMPCVRGYEAPSQECRTCGYCVIKPVGEGGAFTNRYHGHGMVIPVSEEQADAIVDALESEGASALKRPAWDARREAERAKVAQQHADEERARDLERQQRGPYAPLR